MASCDYIVHMRPLAILDKGPSTEGDTNAANVLMRHEAAVSSIVVSEDDDRFYIAESHIPGAGDGLYARVPLERGTRLAVVGVLIAADSVADRCTRYADEHKYRVGDYLLIPLGYGAMANHSSTPNVAKVVEGHDVHLQALRDIEADEELCFAYSAHALERFAIATT